MFVDFSIRLRQILANKKLTQKEAADMIQISPARFSTYATGRNEPPLDVLYSICKTFGVSADWMLGLSDSTPEMVMGITVKRDPYADLIPPYRERLDEMYQMLKASQEHEVWAPAGMKDQSKKSV